MKNKVHLNNLVYMACKSEVDIEAIVVDTYKNKKLYQIQNKRNSPSPAKAYQMLELINARGKNTFTKTQLNDPNFIFDDFMNPNINLENEVTKILYDYYKNIASHTIDNYRNINYFMSNWKGKKEDAKPVIPGYFGFIPAHIQKVVKQLAYARIAAEIKLNTSFFYRKKNNKITISKFYSTPYIKEEFKIIEAGCGLGNVLHTMSYIFPESEIIGYDINKNFINEVNKYNKNYRIKVYEKDILNVDYSEADIIYFYRPISDWLLYTKFLQKVVNDAKKDCFIISHDYTMIEDERIKKLEIGIFQKL